MTDTIRIAVPADLGIPGFSEPGLGQSASEQHAEDVLFSLGNHDIVARSWVKDGTGVMPGGTVGGDGAGESWSVRYLNRYAPMARVTVYFYTVDMRDREATDPRNAYAPYAVKQMTESYLADRLVLDEGHEESDCRYDYDTLLPRYATEAEAEAVSSALTEAHHEGLATWNPTDG